MAGKPAPSSYEPTCQWNQGPVTLIYQWKKIKGVMGVKNDPQAKQQSGRQEMLYLAQVADAGKADHA